MTAVSSQVCTPDDAHMFDADLLPYETHRERVDRHVAAAQLCARCPVAQACLDDALADPHREGIHAGYLLHATPELERHIA